MLYTILATYEKSNPDLYFIPLFLIVTTSNNSKQRQDPCAVSTVWVLEDQTTNNRSHCTGQLSLCLRL